MESDAPSMTLTALTSKYVTQKTVAHAQALTVHLYSKEYIVLTHCTSLIGLRGDKKGLSVGRFLTAWGSLGHCQQVCPHPNGT